MKQVKLLKPGGLNNLQISDADTPRLKEHEVLVKVKASSLNYHDLLVALGHIPTD
ncbi:MAG: NAD(P)-dependent alcohol dehydrogenase, partial [Cellvibrionales bacterium TMED148]